MKTSWTEVNPGKRFLTCSKNGSNCGYFRWFDPPMCVRSKDIIPGLLRRLSKAERKNWREKVLWISLLLSWIIFAIVLLATSADESAKVDSVLETEGNDT